MILTPNYNTRTTQCTNRSTAASSSGDEKKKKRRARPVTGEHKKVQERKKVLEEKQSEEGNLRWVRVERYEMYALFESCEERLEGLGLVIGNYGGRDSGLGVAEAGSWVPISPST